MGEKLDTLSISRHRDKRSVSFACADANQEMHRLNGNMFGKKGPGKGPGNKSERKPLLAATSIRRIEEEVCRVYAAGLKTGFMLVHLKAGQVRRSDEKGRPVYRCKCCDVKLSVQVDRKDKSTLHYVHPMPDGIPLYLEEGLPFNALAQGEIEAALGAGGAPAAAAAAAPAPPEPAFDLPPCAREPSPGPAPCQGRTPSPELECTSVGGPGPISITVGNTPAVSPAMVSHIAVPPAPLQSGAAPQGAATLAPPSAPPAPAAGAIPPTTLPPATNPPPPGPPGGGPPATNPPVPSPLVKGQVLQGRAIQAGEVDDLVDYLGGVRGTGVLTDMRFEHRNERRPVNWRAVRITDSDFDVQKLEYQTVNMFWITVVVLASALFLTLGLGAGLYFGYADVGLTLGVGAIAGMMGLSTVVHRLTRRRGKAIAAVAYLSLVVLLEFARPFPDWLASLLAMSAVIGLYAYTVRAYGNRLTDWEQRFGGVNPALLLLVPVSFGCVAALVLSHTILALCVSWLFYKLLIALRVLLFPNSKRTVVWCPHMVTNVLLDYSEGTSAEVVRTNTRMKLSRLATLPVPDYMASQLTAGSEQVIYFLAERETFFEAGAAFALQPR